MTLSNIQEQEFRNLYRTYSPKIHRLCLGYTGDSMLADDLLQEVFIKVWQHYDKFRGDSQISTWLYRIAVNTCLQYLRADKSKHNTTIDKLQFRYDEADTEKEQQIQLLYKCISELAETDRLIITLLMEEVPYPEIAAATAISEGNLRVKIHRIKQQLTSIYSKYERL